MFSSNVWKDLSAVAVGDFNRDGKLDIAIITLAGNCSSNMNCAFLLLNNGAGCFGISMRFPTGQFNSINSIVVVGFNNDKRLDVVVANYEKNNVGVMLGNGNGNFQSQMTFSTGVFNKPYSLVVNDFNNDGQLDIAVTSSYANNVGILIGIGNGTFLPQIMFSTGAGSQVYSIASGDLNKDGKVR